MVELVDDNGAVAADECWPPPAVRMPSTLHLHAEANSLLMKELDGIRSVTSPNAAFASTSGLATRNKTTALTSVHHPVIAQTSGGNTLLNPPRRSTSVHYNDACALDAPQFEAAEITQSSGGVAKQIYNAVRNRVHRQRGSSLSAGRHTRHGHECSPQACTSVTLVNGNANGSTRRAPSPVLCGQTAPQQRERRKLLDSLTRHKSSNSNMTTAPQPAKIERTGYEVVPKPISQGSNASEASPYPHDMGADEIVAVRSNGEQHDIGDEHECIAYNTQLLQQLHMSPSGSAPSTADQPVNIDGHSTISSDTGCGNTSQKSANQGNYMPAVGSGGGGGGVSSNIYSQNDPGTNADFSPCRVQVATTSMQHVSQSVRHDEQAPCSSASLVEAAPSSPNTEAFFACGNRHCTSYRLKIACLKSPVDACVLSNGNMIVADYDNGMLVLSRGGDVLRHMPVADGKAACGCVCSPPTAPQQRLVVLGYKSSTWTINIYTLRCELTETIICPEDASIEAWAMRKIAIAEDNHLYLMASGEHKLIIWSFDFVERTWRTLVTEGGRKGAYADFSVRVDMDTRDVHFLLCDSHKAQLSLVVITAEIELANIQNVKMRRQKGQEWIVQGPKLAGWDSDGDIIVYDGSGKTFLFDGTRFRCKRIIADHGRGEVGALCISHGWCYVLCRYRLCIDAYLYKESASETAL